MWPVLGSNTVRRLEEATLTHDGLAEAALMERAAQGCVAKILSDLTAGAFGPPGTVGFVVFVGMGNNGGDGLLVSELLSAAGVSVRVLRVHHRDTPSLLHAETYFRVSKIVPIIEVMDDSTPIIISDNEVVIDSILGSGNDRSLDGLTAWVVEQVNASDRPVLAIDLPTGLWVEDNSANDLKQVMQADMTFSLGLPKLSFLLPDTAPQVGNWLIIPLGLHLPMELLHTADGLLQENDVARLLHSRPRFGHKGTFGHALLIAGSEGHMGAAVLTTKAALRSGCGLVTGHIPGCGVHILQPAAPEAMCSIDREHGAISMYPDLNAFNAIGIGPALGSTTGTKQVLKRLIQDTRVPIVLDADALNILSAEPTWLAFLPADSILTPHPLEFDRLVGSRSASSYDRLQRAKDFARKNRCVLVLKGAFTAICLPTGRVLFNPTGNSGMAKGGSGDALTGLLTGLLAQGYSSADAAAIGVYLHGLAGDLAAKEQGMDGMIVSDMIEHFPAAWKQLRRVSEQVFDGAFPQT